MLLRFSFNSILIKLSKSPKDWIEETNIKRLAKKRSNTQSTSLITEEGFAFPKRSIKLAPINAIIGMDKDSIFPKKKPMITNRNIRTDILIFLKSYL